MSYKLLWGGFLSYLFADCILVQADCLHFYFCRFLLFAKDKVVLYLSLKVLTPTIVNAFDIEVSSRKMHKLSEKDYKRCLQEERQHQKWYLGWRLSHRITVPSFYLR